MKKLSPCKLSLFFASTAFILALTSLSCRGQLSNLVAHDSSFVFNNRLRVLYADDETKLTKKVLKQVFRSHFNISDIHCADGFSRDGSRYILFHTNHRYPSTADDASMWNQIFELIKKDEASRFFRSGWFVHKDKPFWFVDRQAVTNDKKAIVAQFTFFELDGKLAIILYQGISEEMLDQLPIQLAFAHHGSELILPIFQCY